MLVTSSIPIPVLEAKNAKPVTKVPPIIPPSQDHHGLSSEKIFGIWTLLEGMITAIAIRTIVAVKNEMKAACTEEYNPIDNRLFIDGCIANIAPPLNPIVCHKSLLSPFFPDDFCHITINIPTKIIRTEINLRNVNGN